MIIILIVVQTLFHFDWGSLLYWAGVLVHFRNCDQTRWWQTTLTWASYQPSCSILKVETNKMKQVPMTNHCWLILSPCFFSNMICFNALRASLTCKPCKSSTFEFWMFGFFSMNVCTDAISLELCMLCPCSWALRILFFHLIINFKSDKMYRIWIQTTQTN